MTNNERLAMQKRIVTIAIKIGQLIEKLEDQNEDFWCSNCLEAIEELKRLKKETLEII